MSSSHHRIVLQPMSSNRNPKAHTLLWFALCAMIPVAYLLTQSVVYPTRELMDDQRLQAEAAIRENEDLLEKLTFHERRLSAVAGNSQLYRLPVLL